MTNTRNQGKKGSASQNRETVWHKFECGGGARWTASDLRFENPVGGVCGFSGCGCETIVKQSGVTTSRDEAHDWFRMSRTEAAS